VFPHDLPGLVANHSHGPGILNNTPFSDALLVELAIAAIDGESLGRGPATDVLAISFSGPDGVGHQFGPASIEIQDTYLRLDRGIARLLTHLDETIGTENVLLFLTSDHGVTHVPQYLTDQGIPGGHFNSSQELDKLRQYLRDNYGDDFLLANSNFELFLDHDFIDRNNLDHSDVQNDVARFVLSLDGVAGVLTADALSYGEFTRGIRERVQQGFHQKRSGDVLYWLEPHTTPGTDPQGTTHGSPWGYDTHAPMHWFGWNVPAGRSAYPVYISDIASTVATFLNSPFPSGNTGRPMNDHMRK
jgi:arylsulfatase A-like enzyme